MTREKGMYEVVWPRGKQIIEGSGRLAKRLDTLEGKTICQLWDWVFRGDQVLPAVGDELAKRFAGVKNISYEVFGSTHGGDEAKVLAALPEKLKQYQCDAVISGMGC